MGKIKIDKGKLKGAIAKSFDAVVEAQSEAFDRAIVEERYDWPGETQRVNGEIAGSPRSIVDTGELLDSKAIARNSSENAAEFSWEAPHALYVHQGVSFQNGTELPGRDWTTPAIAECNPKEVFERELKRNL